MQIQIPNNWRPRDYQMGLWSYLENGGKRAIEVAHRRWGKDDVILHWTAVSLMTKVATYWHMLPEAAQARKAIWNAVNPHTGKRRIDEAFPPEIRENTNDHEMFIRFKNGSTWQVVGSDNFNSLVGAPPYGVVFSEWALANPTAWGILSPILEENGGWAVFITTYRGKNHAYGMMKMAQKSPHWWAEVQTVKETGFPEEKVERARTEYESIYGKAAAEALIQQEYYCNPDVAVLGSVYGPWLTKLETQKRVRPGIYDPELPVHTAWDLGYDDATAIWFYQRAGMEIRWIDYYENNGQDIKHYCDVLAERAYKYGDHYVPHDAANKLLAAGGRSIVQQMYELGVKTRIVAATSQQNGIEALRKILENSWFDTKVEDAFEKLKLYQFEWDDKAKIFRSTPRHDWTSHCADAAEIIGQVLRKEVQQSPAPKPKFLEDLTLNELFEAETASNSNNGRI